MDSLLRRRRASFLMVEHGRRRPNALGVALVWTSGARESNWTLVYGHFQSASVENAFVNLHLFKPVVYELGFKFEVQLPEAC